MNHQTIYLLPLLMALLFTWGITDAEAQKSREVLLSGYKQKPIIATSGTAYMTVEIHSDTLSISGEFNNLSGEFRAAVLMAGEPNHPGNQLFRLKAEVAEDRNNGIFEPKDNRFELGPAQRDLLRSGELFLMITSTEYPNGELRGQIPPMN